MHVEFGVDVDLGEDNLRRLQVGDLDLAAVGVGHESPVRRDCFRAHRPETNPLHRAGLDILDIDVAVETGRCFGRQIRGRVRVENHIAPIGRHRRVCDVGVGGTVGAGRN